MLIEWLVPAALIGLAGLFSRGEMDAQKVAYLSQLPAREKKEQTKEIVVHGEDITEELEFIEL